MKKELFLDEKVFLLNNFDNMTYNEMLNYLNGNRSLFNQLNYSTLRHRFVDLSLSRFSYVPWSKVHTIYLKKNWRIMGNKEIAIVLSSDKFRSKKTFTRQQVRKKMELLNLHRTAEEIKAVVQRNIRLDLTYVNKPGVAVRPPKPNGHISISKTNNGRFKRRIKINGVYVPYGRWNYIQERGEPPEGMCLFRIDLDSLNDDITNFEVRISRNVSRKDLRRACKIIAVKTKALEAEIIALDYKRRIEYKKKQRTLFQELLRLEHHKRNINGKI